ncbi:hypothetical protein LCGC14_2993900, partial [marine sediment metagenome]
VTVDWGAGYTTVHKVWADSEDEAKTAGMASAKRSNRGEYWSPWYTRMVRKIA